MNDVAVGALLAAVTTAIVTIVGFVLTSARERSRIRLLERLSRVRRRLRPGSPAMRSVEHLEDVLAAKMLTHYGFPVSSTLFVFAMVAGGVCVVGGVTWVSSSSGHLVVVHAVAGVVALVAVIAAPALAVAAAVQRGRER